MVSEWEQVLAVVLWSLVQPQALPLVLPSQGPGQLAPGGGRGGGGGCIMAARPPAGAAPGAAVSGVRVTVVVRVARGEGRPSHWKILLKPMLVRIFVTSSLTNRPIT